MGTAYRYLGLATLAGGQYVEAQGYFQKSLEIFGEYFEGWDIALSLIYLGDAIRASGDLSEAEKIYLRGLRVAKEAQSMPLMLDALIGLAQLNAQIGETERALELMYFILNHPYSTQETKDLASGLILETEVLLTGPQVQEIKSGVSGTSIEEILDRFII